jgi:uncharacterized protein YyaL (SSP411 family)
MTSDSLFPAHPASPTGIDWNDWGIDVFEEARTRNVPVLMLIANAWSARCQSAVRALAIDGDLEPWLRERVALAAVDADERPDLAARYLDGEPPNAVVLTPEGDPLVRAERVNPGSIRATIEGVLADWSARHDELMLEAETDRATRAAERAAALGRRSPGALTPAILDVALEVLEAGDTAELDAAAAGEAIRLWRYAHLRRGTSGALDRAQQTAWGLIAAGRFEGDFGAVLHLPDDNAITAWDQATVLLALGELALIDDEAADSLREPVERMALFCIDVLGEPYGGFRHAASDLDPAAADPRVFAASSARVARALVVASIPYARSDWIERGLRGTDFLLEHLRAGEGGMYHRWLGSAGGFGFLGDQAETLLALLQAYEVSGRTHYFEQAQRLARIVERDWREPGRGFRDLSELLDAEAAEAPGLLAETQLPLDENVSMAEALLWISRLTHDERHIDAAVETMAMFATGLERHGPALASYARVVDRLLSAEPEVKVVAEQPPGEPDRVADPLMAAALRLPVAGRTVQRLTLDADEDILRQLGLPLDVARAAYVCIGTACSAPLTQPEQLLPAAEEMIESPV